MRLRRRPVISARCALRSRSPSLPAAAQPLILMTAYVRLRHRHQGRGAVRTRPAVTEEPPPGAELLKARDDRRRGAARTRGTAVAAEGLPQQAILFRSQINRPVGFAFAGRAEYKRQASPSITDNRSRASRSKEAQECIWLVGCLGCAMDGACRQRSTLWRHSETSSEGSR